MSWNTHFVSIPSLEQQAEERRVAALTQNEEEPSLSISDIQMLSAVSAMDGGSTMQQGFVRVACLASDEEWDNASNLPRSDSISISDYDTDCPERNFTTAPLEIALPVSPFLLERNRKRQRPFDDEPVSPQEGRANWSNE